MLNFFRKLIPLDSPIRISYHYMRGVIAYAISGNPARDMIVIGITGTKGKTTTTNLIAKGLQEAGKHVAMFSTVNMMIDGEMEDNNLKMTSPSPFVLWDFLARAKEAGCNYAVIETSSHALYYHRVHGLRFDIAVVTGIAQDHLDLHGTMENYVDTKILLFKNLYKYGIRKELRKIGVVNIDNEYASRFLTKDIVVDNMMTVGFSPSAQIRAQHVVHTKTATELDIRMPSNHFHLSSPLQGDFNIGNILCAIAVFVSQKIEVPKIQEIIKNFQSVPGRLEEIPNLRGAKIYVDYAHTEDSLRNVLETLRKIEGGKRIITVFGATGDRDKTKRPKMGKVVDNLSEIIILTDDDTYTEDSIGIIRDVTNGINRKEGEKFWIIPSREDAIRTALIMTQESDILLVAGKGAETVQVTQEGAIPWNDRKVIERTLMEIEAQVMLS
ncbi:UDP-N-acetylmuramoyl-L-alanyl-D-glutamate--2,6-diaminopimelate ligase [Candidatus Gracilibacteria bacterium]|nr:UDP-N-acetylmuramoyl-L-alanyl-D-glutamate--2,6-diaminopimelate ligase [Candidatus Gracilibacteria bacterium]